MAPRKLNIDEARKKFNTHPRWIEDEKKSDHQFLCLRQQKIYRLAAPSERSRSENVPVFHSSVEDIGPLFGIGVGLYFRRILALFWLSLAYGIVLLPQTAYYFSKQYNDEMGKNILFLAGSAVCTGYSRVEVTQNCDPTSKDCEGVNAADSCPLVTRLGIYDFIGVSIAFICSLLAVCWYLKLIQEIAVSQPTPKDYSIVVNNPTDDQDNPDDWKEWFEKRYGKVAYVTITRKNKVLLKELAKQRDIIQQVRDDIQEFADRPFEETFRTVSQRAQDLSYKAKSKRTLDMPKRLQEENELEKISEKGLLLPNAVPNAGLCNSIGLFFSTLWAGLREATWTRREKVNAANVLYTEHRRIWRKIKKLKQQQYGVCKVFITFVTEESKRKAMKDLENGYLQSWLNKNFTKAPEKRFQDNLLDVQEPSEPTDIIWYNLEKQQFIWAQAVLVVIGNGAIITFCYFYILFLKTQTRTIVTALGISITNALLPFMMRLTSFGEVHCNEGTKQVWLFKKLSFARIMNTALINFVTTGFSSVLSVEEMLTIQLILVVDAIVSPTISLLDLPGLFKRHIRSRFAQTQASLNACYSKTDWHLGERYASMSKTLFVAMFYAALYPPGMFIAAFCFIYTYWVDKYLLLRRWKKPPQYDARFAYQGIQHTLLCVLAHILVTANWYYEWPFDNTILTDQGYKFQRKENVTPSDYSTWYKALIIQPAHWQNEDQQWLVYIFGTSGIVLTAFLLLLFFGSNLITYCLRLFHGFYRPIHPAQKESFHEADNPYIQAYVPMCYPSEKDTADPLMAADCENLANKHLPILSLTSTYQMPKRMFSKRGHGVQHTEESVRVIKLESKKKTNVALDIEDKIERKKLFGIVKGYQPQDIEN